MNLDRKTRLTIISLLIAVVMLVGLGVSLLVGVPTAAGFTIWYDFETDLDGWKINPYSLAITDVRRSRLQAYTGEWSMELLLDLRDEAHYDSGEVYVDIEKTDLSGKTLVAWVYAPEGARGHLEIATASR